jgi:hypothetical protein
MKIETVLRWVASVILVHVGGSPTLALASTAPCSSEPTTPRASASE